MSTIQVLDVNDHTLGTGDGSITPPSATIDHWTEKAGLIIGKSYKLKSSGKLYRARCTANGLPVTFDLVE